MFALTKQRRIRNIFQILISFDFDRGMMAILLRFTNATALFAIYLCSLLVWGRGSNDHLHNVTESPSFLIGGDLRVQNIEEHRRLGTVPAYQNLWDNWYKNGYYWIRVYIDTSFSDDAREKITKSFRSLQWRAKVIKFKFLHALPNHKNWPYLKVVDNKDGCWSWFGRTYDAHIGQEIALEEGWCTDSRTIQHEILHAMGFAHEQSRPDRDNFVEVVYENIKPEWMDNFDIWEEIDSLEVPYDLNSIMHYSEYDFSINPRFLPTIKPLDGKSIGTLEKASWWDIVQLRLLYQCEKAVGPRTLSQFKAQPCSEPCQCWKKRTGCKSNHNFCKGKLVCHKNTCKDPKDVPSGNSEIVE